MLRREVGRQTGVRLTPTLEFILDAIPENARSIEDLLVAARTRDEELARAKEGAAYAGEADPDRVPREDDPALADDDWDEDDLDEDDAEETDADGTDGPAARGGTSA